MSSKKWESYEQVAAYLLNQFAEHFGLGRFEGKQVLPGASGTNWEIDAKGYAEDGSRFVIVECKRHTKSGISQEVLAGLAWRIQDTGASGGILVTPIGLQTGAQMVAAYARVHAVRLDQNSTTTEYILRFLNHVMLGVGFEAISVSATIVGGSLEVVKKPDGSDA